MTDPNETLESLNISSATIFASTPFKVPAAKGKKGRPKKPPVRPICDICNVCGKEYRCHRSYKNHMTQHSIKDAASKYPSVSQILEHCSSSVFKVCQGLTLKPAYGKMGVTYQKLLQHILSNEGSVSVRTEWTECFRIIHEAITKDVGEQKVLLPSVLINTLVKNNEIFLSDLEKRKHFCELLKVCVLLDDIDVCINDVLNCFLTDYSLMLVQEIFAYYSQCLRDAVQENLSANDEHYELTHEQNETVHYISGATVRSFFNKSKSFPNNIFWRQIGRVITEKLLESDTVPGPPSIVKGWTISKNKGKLFFVSGKLFYFFVGVAEILHKSGGKSLKVDASRVISSVCNGCVLLLWDEAVGDSLGEKQSYDLMCGFVRSFSTTYAVGKVKQMMNNFRKNKAEASIALRARVAPKS